MVVLLSSSITRMSDTDTRTDARCGICTVRGMCACVWVVYVYVNIYTFHFTYCLSTTRMPDTTASDAAPYRYEVVVIHNLMILLLLSIARMLES